MHLLAGNIRKVDNMWNQIFESAIGGTSLDFTEDVKLNL